MADHAYIPNPLLLEQLTKQPSMNVFMRRKAGEARIAVVHAAPRGSGPKGGGFRKSIRQVGWRVVSTDIAAHLIEWGSVNNITYAPFRRGVRAAGLRLVVQSK